MKFDRRTGQSMIKAAMRERHARGKYDVFAWTMGGKLMTLTVAWKTFTKRSIALATTDLGTGEEVQTNAIPLPNGVDTNGAHYVGSLGSISKLV